MAQIIPLCKGSQEFLLSGHVRKDNTKLKEVWVVEEHTISLSIWEGEAGRTL